MTNTQQRRLFSDTIRNVRVFKKKNFGLEMYYAKKLQSIFMYTNLFIDDLIYK